MEASPTAAAAELVSPTVVPPIAYSGTSQNDQAEDFGPHNLYNGP